MAAGMGHLADTAAGGDGSMGAMTAAFVHIYNGEFSGSSRYKNLHGKWNARIDVFNENGEARHEIHVYHKEKEVGLYKEGRFFNKHGHRLNGFPEGITEEALIRLNGLDIEMLKHQGRWPKGKSAKGFSKALKAFRTVPVVGTAAVAVEVISNPEDSQQIILESLGIMSTADGTVWPKNW